MTPATIKELVRQRDGYRCAECGISQEEYAAKWSNRHKVLDVHRKVPDAPYSVDGCTTLCRSCHCAHRRDYVGKKVRRVSNRRKTGVISISLEELNELARLKFKSITHLAASLEVSETAVRRWLSGRASPSGPASILMRQWLSAARTESNGKRKLVGVK